MSDQKIISTENEFIKIMIRDFLDMGRISEQNEFLFAAKILDKNNIEIPKELLEKILEKTKNEDIV